MHLYKKIDKQKSPLTGNLLLSVYVGSNQIVQFNVLIFSTTLGENVIKIGNDMDNRG